MNCIGICKCIYACVCNLVAKWGASFVNLRRREFSFKGVVLVFVVVVAVANNAVAVTSNVFAVFGGTYGYCSSFISLRVSII